MSNTPSLITLRSVLVAIFKILVLILAFFIHLLLGVCVLVYFILEISVKLMHPPSYLAEVGR